MCLHEHIQPGRQSHYVLNTNMTSSCFNLPPNSEIKPRQLWHDPEMSNDSGVVSREGRKICKARTCWHQWSATNYSIHIHKAPANLKQWHQFPRGQLACCFFSPSLFTIKWHWDGHLWWAGMRQALMKDGPPNIHHPLPPIVGLRLERYRTHLLATTAQAVHACMCVHIGPWCWYNGNSRRQESIWMSLYWTAGHSWLSRGNLLSHWSNLGLRMFILFKSRWGWGNFFPICWKNRISLI